MSHLLFIDDEESICWGLTRLARRMGHSSEAVGTAELGLAAASRTRPDAIVLDVRLPGMTGLEAITQLREIVPETPVVLVTAYGDLETAVEAIRRGAFEYLVKPFDLQLAESTILRALAAAGARNQSTSAEAETDSGLAATTTPDQIIGRSPAMQAVFRQIAIVAPSSACVHLRGESGTGKELVARAIHRYSQIATGPFVAVNLAALNPALAESELFGHVRGAFTGAEGSRKGLLEQADGGTIFLDEVADIPMELQVKLLRTLEHGEIWPVGADAPRRSSFRLVSATHQDLRQRVAAGTFRHDLYFRLVTFDLELPPLRERREDIALLTQYFLERFSPRREGPAPILTEAALHELQQRPWFGNVRELRNTMEHALVLSRGGVIEPIHFPPPAAPVGGEPPPARSLEQLVAAWTRQKLDTSNPGSELYEEFLALVEPSLYQTVLNHCRGQVAAAARILGIHRTTLKRKLDDWGLAGKDDA